MIFNPFLWHKFNFHHSAERGDCNLKIEMAKKSFGMKPSEIKINIINNIPLIHTGEPAGERDIIK
jgi:hypothetical protein